MNTLLCDDDGVPLLIQRLRYNSGDMTFSALFFNGEWRQFPSEFVCPSIGLRQYGISRMQELEAENKIEMFALANWRKMFPSLKLVT